MLIKLLTSRVSVDENGGIVSHDEGARVELTDDEAQRLIDSGQAERVQVDANAETETHADAKPKRGKTN